MLPVHRAGRRADAGSLLYVKDFPLVRADPYSGGARRRVAGRPATARLVQVLFDELPASRRSTCSCRYQTTRNSSNGDDDGRGSGALADPSQWAAVFAMSERNLARPVVRETGLSFRRWRHQLQLILALQLLIRGQTVQQTAQALGYDSTTAFITMFKKGSGRHRAAITVAGYDFPINNEMIPAAISGPTGTPRNRATPSTVPTSSPATRCGWSPSGRRRARRATKQTPDRNRQQRFPVHKGVDQRRGRQRAAGDRRHHADGQNNDPDGRPCFSTRKEGVQRRDAHDNQHEDGDRHGGVMTDKAERRQTQQDQQGGIKHVQRSLPK